MTLVNDCILRFLKIIPSRISLRHQLSPKHFCRKRKLPFPRLVTFLLSITLSGKSKGVDSKSGEFFKNARRSGLWPKAEAIHRSALTKARKKLPWEVLEEIHEDAVNLAYELWPHSPDYTWKEMFVFAIDGSKFRLPATPELRKEFDPSSGLENPGKGHYPQCLVSTAYDVFRRFPVARTVVAYDSCEREQAKALIPKIPSGNILMFDRGYPSFEIFKHLNENYDGYYLIRSPASSSFKVVSEFVKSQKQEDIVMINPTSKYIYKDESNRRERKKKAPLKLRVIKLVSPDDGTVSVILTNLMDKKKFSSQEIIDLYFRRWEVESYYRDEKTFLEVDTFHSRTSNGIRQELFAALIMSVIARTLMVVSLQLQDQNAPSQNGQLQSPKDSTPMATLPEPQFKNAVMTLATEAAILTPDNPRVAIRIFKEVLEEIRRVKYYRPKVPRKPKPRVTKTPPSKWAARNPKKKGNACSA